MEEVKRVKLRRSRHPHSSDILSEELPDSSTEREPMDAVEYLNTYHSNQTDSLSQIRISLGNIETGGPDNQRIELTQQYTRYFEGMFDLPDHVSMRYTYYLKLESSDYCGYLAIVIGLLITSIWPVVPLSCISNCLKLLKLNLNDTSFLQQIEDFEKAKVKRNVSRADLLEKIVGFSPKMIEHQMKMAIKDSVNDDVEQQRISKAEFSGVNESRMKFFAEQLKTVIIVWNKCDFKAFFPTSVKSENLPVVHLLYQNKSRYRVLVPKVLSDKYQLLDSSEDEAILNAPEVKEALFYSSVYNKDCKMLETGLANLHFFFERVKTQGDSDSFDRDIPVGIECIQTNSFTDQKEKSRQWERHKPQFSLLGAVCRHYFDVNLLKSQIHIAKSAELLLSKGFEDIRCALCNDFISDFDKLRCLGTQSYRILKDIDSLRKAYIEDQQLVQCLECEAYKTASAFLENEKICLSCCHFKSSLTGPSNELELLLYSKSNQLCFTSSEACSLPFISDPVVCPNNCSVCMKCKNSHSACPQCAHIYSTHEKQRIRQFYPSCRICKQKLMSRTRMCRCSCRAHNTEESPCRYCGQALRETCTQYLKLETFA